MLVGELFKKFRLFLDKGVHRIYRLQFLIANTSDPLRIITGSSKDLLYPPHLNCQFMHIKPSHNKYWPFIVHD